MPKSKANFSVVNDELIDWVIREEGFLNKPTDIGDGKITIGSGLTDPKWIDKYKKKGYWSKEDNRKAVAEELQKRSDWAKDTLPNWDTLPLNAKRAMLSYKYNYDFTRDNSPKLFGAMENGNFVEAIRQMDATSKNPKFKKGLQARREREQQWGLQGLFDRPSSDRKYEYPDATTVVNPYTAKVQNITFTDQAVPTNPSDNLIEAEKVSAEVNEYDKVRRALDTQAAFRRLIQDNAWENQEPKKYVPSSGINYIVDPYAEGGNLNKKKLWDELSMKEKADMIRVAVENGITTLPEIREKYNDFAEGGNIYDGTTEDSQQMEVGPTVDGGTLREVIVRRLEDPVWILGQKNPAIRKALLTAYEKEDTSDDVDDSGFPTYLEKPQATRLLEVYRKAGQPKIKSLPDGKHRAYYNPLINTMRVDTSGDYEETFEDIIAELAHPLQSKYGNNAPWKEDINIFSNADAYKDATRYNYPETYEGETHSDFEPLVYYYLDQHIIPGQTWITGTPGIGYDEPTENPTFEQVLDSAKVFNRRRQENNYKYPNVTIPQKGLTIFRKIRDWKL